MSAELIPSGSVTTADLYRELIGFRADVSRALTRIEVLDSRNSDADALHADHETRLRQLETFKARTYGIAVTVSVLSGLFSGGFGYLLGHR